MKHINLLCFALFLAIAPAVQAQQYTIPQGLQEHQYVSHQLLFKLREQYRPLANENGINSPLMEQLLLQLGGGSVRKNFPAIKQPRKKFNDNGERLADLSLLYEVHFNSNMSIYAAAALLQKSGLVEYLQPRFTAQPMSVPNDPLVGQQYHHALIKSFEAWDIEPGNPNIVIGITDAGIQFNHEDLGNVAYNTAEILNGIDDDNNGYIDDYAGWNTVNNTNDPTATLSPHGMFTSGMSNATVNNGLGLAGNANQCRFIPIRIDDASGFNYGYEGIVYAAARGCQIVNASWGNTFPGPVNEEAIRYATVNQGVLIVAACGNSSVNEKYYPASYENVFSVGATGATDLKWSGSTFSPSVDIVAPGELVRSCWPFNGYDISSGTSFSSPLVAGAAALVKSHFPAYTAQQVAERLRVTADASIYALPGNAPWNGMMGSGRLNMLRALSDPETPSVHFIETDFRDAGNDATLQAGENISITGLYKNFLAPTSNLAAVISCASPFVTILNGNNTPGLIGTLASTSNNANPFSFHIADNAPYNLDLLFRIDYTDGSYSAFEYLEIRVNRDYLNIDINHLNTTITSRGSIGYNADYASEGMGVTLDSSQSLIYTSGFILGSSAVKTADNVYAASIPGYDNDFFREQGAQYIQNNAAAQRIQSAFYTDSAATERLVIRQTSEAFSATPDDHAIVMKYVIKNTGTMTANAIHAGIFTDWDIQNAGSNQAAWDATRELSYAFQSGGIYAGVKQLEGPAAHGYCFNSDGNSGSVNLYDGFSNVEKFATLSGSQIRTAAPTGDVANMIGTAAFNLPAGDSITISFVLLAANNLAELQAAADRAQSLYNFTSLNSSLEVVGESCLQNDGYIQFSAVALSGSSVELSTSDGISLATSADLSNFEYTGLLPGNYLLTFSFDDGSTYTDSFEIEAVVPVQLAITASSGVVALPNATVDFTALSTGADSYSWDFGYDTPVVSDQNPTHTFIEQGTFIVTCIASNGNCSDTVTVEILVGDPLGMEIVQTSNQVFPNPASDFINIQLNMLQEKTWARVFNLSGQEILRQELPTNQTQLNVSQLSNGVYFLQIETATQTEMHRIVIAK
jgi:serine protease